MGDSITAHNNLAFMTNAQVEPIDANISRETLLQTDFTLQQRPTCISCDDKNDANLFAAPCKHGYCDECLASYVKSALEPDGNFPPRCRNLPITLQSARPHLHYDLVKSYEERYAEINAACSLLFARPGCCVVIPQEKIVEGLGHCTACNNYTCTRCRLQKHRDKLCPTDAEQEDLLKLAKEKGWCRCYRCNNMIELNFGCNHMTCICKAEFCYVCGTIWKNCNCPRFHDDYHEELRDDIGAYADRGATGYPPGYRRRTVFRAERAVERYAKHLRQTWGMPDPRSREEQIEEVRNEVENGCDHGYWRIVRKEKSEPGHCKLCKYVGHKRIYQCLFCPLTSCWACHTDAPPEYRRDEEQQQQQ